MTPHDDDLAAFLDELGPAGPPLPELDPIWERLAAGELTADERASLEAKAETDPETAELLRVYAPLAPALVHEGTERAKMLMSAERAAPPVRWPVVTTLLAMAAAVFLFVMPPTATPQAGWAVESVRQGAQEQRAPAPNAPIRFAPGGTLDMTLEGPSAIAKQVAVWLEQDGLQRIPTETITDGTRLRVRGTIPGGADAGRPATLILLPASPGTIDAEDVHDPAAIRHPVSW